MDVQESDARSSTSASRSPIIRGARACKVCRQAKMKCVGSEDGTRQCQRCKRSNVECVFEKHKRGRKPGSKLSEASKMLRRLEKGLNTAKLKSQAGNATSASYPDSHNASVDNSHYSGPMPTDSYGSFNSQFPSVQLPPLNLSSDRDGPPNSSHGSHTTLDGDEDDDNERGNSSIYPAKLIKRENQRHSTFFKTILNPEQGPHSPSANSPTGDQDPMRPAPIPHGLNDPITAGIITEHDAINIFDLVFLRLNPFINLFDPALHSVAYVRSKCPFLFTTLIMAGAKFFKPEVYRECLKLAKEFAVRAFADAWKRVEVVQAFACLTYWKEPDDNRTWTYIGYACRMAIELGLNRYVNKAPPYETEMQLRERRNRERTYLVLWVHDRSLSTQTGRHWMLPEDDLVKTAETWHQLGGNPIRPEDVIIASFIKLRHIAAETTEIFHSSRGLAHSDVNAEVVLSNCNNSLTEWMETWEEQMTLANGESFHFSFIKLFRVYCRLFLNSFGIQASIHTTNRATPSLQALSVCYTSASETLRIVSGDLAKIGMLRYGQDSITVMSAYAAVFLLKLVSSPNTSSSLPEGAAAEIHDLISKTASAYFDATPNSPSTSAMVHARFLHNLVNNDVFRAPAAMSDRDRFSIDPRLRDAENQAAIQSSASKDVISQAYPDHMVQAHGHPFRFPASPRLPPLPEPLQMEYNTEFQPNNSAQVVNYPIPVNANMTGPSSNADARYWMNTFLELGFGANVDHSVTAQHMLQSNVRNIPFGEHYPNQQMAYHPDAIGNYGR